MPYQEQYSDDEVGSLFLWVVASHRLVWHDVSGQRSGPIFKGQGVQEGRPLTYILGQHIGPIFRVKMSKKKAFFLDLSVEYVQEESLLFMFLTLNKGTNMVSQNVSGKPSYSVKQPRIL